MKALALFSGGLDSVLAIKLIVDQGIEVLAVNINTGFGSTKDRLEHMQNMCNQIGVELRIVDIQDEYLQDVLFDPKYGYGKHFNPCIDCHAKMFEIAKKMMHDEKADFLISGEVIAQRPMSQNKEALENVLNSSQCNGILLRPLSAKLLPPTIAELNGWVDREKLEGISGRNRERQLELAKEIGLRDFETPGGGCLLTDANFTIKMLDYIKYDTFEKKDIPIMKFGRHLRLPDGAKLVIGRNKEENQPLQEIKNNKYIHIKTDGFPGPYSLISSNASSADKLLACRIILTYTKAKHGETYQLLLDEKPIKATPFADKSEFKSCLILH